jgi:ATP-dependent Clp protease ATP-binding subunit ClpC
VFERFTERARQVVVLAQDEARELRHNYIGTEHLLLGLLREREGVAAQVLNSLDVTLDEVRAQVARIIGPGDEPLASGQIPFTPRAKMVLELALREARSFGQPYLGTEHLLLGLVRENEGVAARILLDFDADPDKVRSRVIQMLGGVPSGSSELHEVGRVDLGESRRWGSYARAAGKDRLLLLGWALGTSSIAIGILIGWAIWGL